MKVSFAGFDSPESNWSKLPHQLIAAFPLIETLGEALVILYVLRHTWGFGDEEKWITMDEFMQGRKRRDGTRFDNGTGLTAPTIRDGLARAVEHGFLIVRTDDSDKARIRHYYALHAISDAAVGERSFPPDRKKFSPRGKEVFPLGKDSLQRSEKETDRKKPKKETLETASQGEEEFAAVFQTIESAMEMTRADCEYLRELWIEFPDLKRHHYAFIQTRDHAAGFNLVYYDKSLRSYRGSDRQNSILREATYSDTG